ncbi:hypothetical protein B566_EDAN017933, partial [Ephemera danica]
MTKAEQRGKRITCHSVCAMQRFPSLPPSPPPPPPSMYHTLFPKDAEIRAKWTAALRRDNFKPTNGSTLCSKHFDSDCFEKSGWTTRANLKQGSIPTIFDFPEHLQRNVAKRKPPKQRDEPHPKKSIEANTEPSSDDDNRLGDHEANSHDDSLDVVESHVTDESPDVMDLSSKSVEMNKEKQKTFRKSYVGDFIENDMQDPRKARQFFRTAQGRIQQNRKYIKVLRQTVRRKTEKIASMEQLVDHLENQKLVTQPASDLLLHHLLPNLKLMCLTTLLPNVAQDSSERCEGPGEAEASNEQHSLRFLVYSVSWSCSRHHDVSGERARAVGRADSATD